MSSTWEKVMAYLPVDYHALTHSGKWLTSGSVDKFYPNPHFHAPEDEMPLLGNQGIVLYLIHGTADYSDGFNEFIDKLWLKLPSYIYGIRKVALEKRFQGLSIEDQAEQIIKKIIENGDTDVGFIGHSRGGLNSQRVDAMVCEKKIENIKVHFVINLCTPYQGSYLAIRPLTGLSTSVSQMVIGCDYLKKVAQEVMKSSAIYYFILARNDFIVEKKKCFVEEYIKLHPDSLFVIENVGHLSIIENEYSAKCCISILEKLPLSLQQKATKSYEETTMSLEEGRLEEEDEKEIEEFEFLHTKALG